MIWKLLLRRRVLATMSQRPNTGINEQEQNASFCEHQRKRSRCKECGGCSAHISTSGPPARNAMDSDDPASASTIARGAAAKNADGQEERAADPRQHKHLLIRVFLARERGRPPEVPRAAVLAKRLLQPKRLSPSPSDLHSTMFINNQSTINSQQSTINNQVNSR